MLVVKKSVIYRLFTIIGP